MSFLNRSLGPLFFPSILWRSKHTPVHLTFDDGPHPSATPQVLELLQKFDIQATFFMLGDQVAKYPELARLVVTLGHTIGSHGMSHRSLFLKPLTAQRTEIARAKSTIEDRIGISPRSFRPPYGRFDLTTLQVTAREGMKLVMWDVDSQDFSARAADQIARSVLRQTSQGSIILFHDNDLTAVRNTSYLSTFIEKSIDRGFSFAPILL